MSVIAIALVFLMAAAACTAMSLVTWGLILEARANRESHRELSLT